MSGPTDGRASGGRRYKQHTVREKVGKKCHMAHDTRHSAV